MRKASKKSKNILWLTTIWITWSYGKSSVKEYLSSILEHEWNTLKTPENQNTEMWVSNLILNKLNKSYKYFVAEMWAYKRGEIETLWKIVNHKHGILTAVGTQHIWLFWGIENTKIGKAELAKKVEENNWTLYINWENENIRTIKFSKNLNLIKYWNEKWSDVQYKIKSSSDAETSFVLEYKKQNYNFIANLIWEHNILNLSWVLALCIDIWISEKKLAKYLKNLSKPKNTLEIIKTPNYTLINDSYNLPENWAIAAIEVLKNYKWNRVLIMDDIFELWNKSEEIHINLWKKIAEEWKVDKVLFIWSNFEKYFINWLLKWWFQKENIIKWLNEIEKWSTILFEWRTSKKYLDKIQQNV
jgi:UDP-N-acetylmuramoyl-tripeptide--D-alanyl-D-alanine ligase